uniref:hypothetical protein n=1 Tax=Nocardia suismassiliense TaxID=2077092 RepID=UPI003F493459
MIATSPPTSRRWPIMAVVIGILAVLALGPGAVPASAAGFECKEVPAPQSPATDIVAMFDSDSAERQDPNDHTGYGSYGWAGLTWYTYDLGCGDDLTRAPKAVADTGMGNSYFKAGQVMAGISFWLDRQTSTPAQAEAQGRTSFLTEFDKLIISITQSIKDTTYGKYMALALCIVGVVIMWRGLRADAASVTKSVLLGATALMLGALFVGAPQEAIKISDDTFAQLITDQQKTLFETTGTSGRPRDVVLDQILLPDYTRGWFGDLAAADAAQLEPQIRDALALSYDEQEAIERDPKASNAIVDAKKQKFQQVVSGLEGNGLSYHTFQGKDSNRISIGLLSMVKVSTISILWTGASLLKLVALLAVRLAILAAPLWIPVAAVSGGVMERVLRGLLAAYLWGVAASVLLSVYLLSMVRLYQLPAGAVSPAWKFWLMLLLTIATWAVMRPFKRISNITRQNNTSVLNRSGMRRKARMLADLSTGRLPRVSDATGGGRGSNKPGTDRKGPVYGKQAAKHPSAMTNNQQGAAADAAQFIYATKMDEYHKRRAAGIDDPAGSKSSISGGAATDGQHASAGADDAKTSATAGRVHPSSINMASSHPIFHVSSKGRPASAIGRTSEPAGTNNHVWSGQLWVPTQSSRDTSSGGAAHPPSRRASAVTGPPPSIADSAPIDSGSFPHSGSGDS